MPADMWLILIAFRSLSGDLMATGPLLNMKRGYHRWDCTLIYFTGPHQHLSPRPLRSVQCATRHRCYARAQTSNSTLLKAAWASCQRSRLEILTKSGATMLYAAPYTFFWQRFVPMCIALMLDLQEVGNALMCLITTFISTIKHSTASPLEIRLSVQGSRSSALAWNLDTRHNAVTKSKCNDRWWSGPVHREWSQLR